MNQNTESLFSFFENMPKYYAGYRNTAVCRCISKKYQMIWNAGLSDKNIRFFVDICKIYRNTTRDRSFLCIPNSIRYPYRIPDLIIWQVGVR